MNASTENKSSIIKILLIALAVNFLAALSHGQESAAQWLEDAKAAFVVIIAPSQDELQKPMVELGATMMDLEAVVGTGISNALAFAGRLTY